MTPQDSLHRRAAEPQGRTTSPLTSRSPATLAALREELLRAGVERMLAQALEVEAELHISRYRDLRDASGKRRVVRNGYLPPRRIVCGAGEIGIHQPRIHDSRVGADGRRLRFTSQVLPAYARTATCIARPPADELLHGVATGDLGRAFRAVFGAVVDELPRSFVPRLEEVWAADRDRLSQRAFQGREHAQIWADAAAVPADIVGAASETLVIAATTPDGVDVLDVRLGRGNDVESWSELLADLVGRGFAAQVRGLHASAPEPARAAFARLADRTTG